MSDAAGRVADTDRSTWLTHWRDLAYALWMLGWCAAAIAGRDATWCAVGGVTGLGARIVAARGAWTPSARFGAANRLTLARLGLVTTLAGLYTWLGRPGFAALVLALFALDGVDGWLARARHEASPFGAAFDMETDALGVMMLSLLLWQHRLAGAWVLAAGLWRYAYAALVALLPPLAEAPRSRLGRTLFGVLMLSFAAAFLPWPRLSPLFAALGTAAVSFSFVRSLAHSRPRRLSAPPPPAPPACARRR